MLCHKDYYKSLLNTTMDYPNPSFNQIELDLTRTFVDMALEDDAEKLIPSLKNVLCTYVKRNPTIGYCQGMNFIVGRMIQYMNEEEAFWTLTMILETILPLDFYCNMVGALIDQRVFKELVKQYNSRLYFHLMKINFDPSMLSFQWFVCFFTHNLTESVSILSMRAESYVGLAESLGPLHDQGDELNVHRRSGSP